jgi:cell wall-associated NlpC family hydrolase
MKQVQVDGQYNVGMLRSMVTTNISPSVCAATPSVALSVRAWRMKAIALGVALAGLAATGARAQTSVPPAQGPGWVAGQPLALNAEPKGDLDQLLRDKGLISQLGQISGQVTDKAGELVVAAMGFLGVPYKRGGNSFETGFDCSGFVKALYEQVSGLVLPRRAEQQAAATQTIEQSELQPGDLVFFNTLRRAFSHVGIYVGDGKFIHSPRAGAEVRVEDMHKAYWRNRFDGARRVAATATDARN